VQTTRIRVLLADNHLLIREGLKSILSADRSFQVIGEVTDSEELATAVRKAKPDLVIIDYSLPGFFNTEDIKVLYSLSCATNILVITNNQSHNDILKVLEYGVTNYILKLCDKKELMGAVYATVRKEKFVCSKVIDAILNKHFPQENSCEGVSLSQREVEIVALISKGFTNSRIAEKLFLSVHTISTHRKNILKKIGVNKSSELVMYAIKTGIIESPTI
jgi:DNA-binding NarL/FixJ family response regulator